MSYLGSGFEIAHTMLNRLFPFLAKIGSWLKTAGSIVGGVVVDVDFLQCSAASGFEALTSSNFRGRGVAKTTGAGLGGRSLTAGCLINDRIFRASIKLLRDSH